MKVTEKYKQTEVGLIPSDWEALKLGDCLLKNPDYGINAAAVEYDDTLPTYLRITDISEDGKFISSNKASVNNSLSNSYYLEKGDIVFARTGASVGKTYLYNENDGRLVFAGFLIRIKANPEVVDYRYLIYLTQTKTYWAWVSANSMRSGQPGLNSNEYKSFQIPLPPTKAEQTAIATALSDADALISGLEKLIAKKRNIKQGAMQKLLNPMENGELIMDNEGNNCQLSINNYQLKKGWEVKKLGEICDNIGSGKSKTQSQDGKYPIFGSTGIIGWSNDYDYYGHKILVARVGANAGTVNIVEGNYCVSDNTLMVSLKPEINLNFIYSFLILFQLNKLVFGSGQPLITGGQLKNIEISLPKTKEEQTHIATILSDMDAEITALETKLEKYKKVKLGMMQNLLTGKIRLNQDLQDLGINTIKQ